MKESGKMTKHMDLESTITLMELAMRGIGVRISSMDMARRHGLIAHVTKVNIKMAKRMDLANSTGQTTQPTRGSSLITIYME